MFGGMAGDLSSLHAPCASHLSRISLHDQTNVSGDDGWQYSDMNSDLHACGGLAASVVLTPVVLTPSSHESSQNTPLLHPHSNATTQPHAVPRPASGAALFSGGGGKGSGGKGSGGKGSAASFSLESMTLESMTSMSSMLKELDALLGITGDATLPHTDTTHATQLDLGPGATKAWTCPASNGACQDQVQGHKPCSTGHPRACAGSRWMQYGSSTSIAGFHYNISSSESLSHGCSEDNVQGVLDLSWSMEHEHE